MPKRKEILKTSFLLPDGTTVYAGDHVDLLYIKTVTGGLKDDGLPALAGVGEQKIAWVKGYYVFDFYYFTPSGEQKIKPLSQSKKDRFYHSTYIPLVRRPLFNVSPLTFRLETAPVAYFRDWVRKHEEDAIDFNEVYSCLK